MRECSYCGCLHPKDFIALLDQYDDARLFKKRVVLRSDKGRWILTLPSIRRQAHVVVEHLDGAAHERVTVLAAESLWHAEIEKQSIAVIARGDAW